MVDDEADDFIFDDPEEEIRITFTVQDRPSLLVGFAPTTAKVDWRANEPYEGDSFDEPQRTGKSNIPPRVLRAIAEALAGKKH